MKNLVAIAFALCLVSATAAPVIGLLSIPSKVDGHPPGNFSYVPASYVKLIESAGAQVVPIPYDATEDQVNFLLNQVNGVFFIGGGADLYKNENGKPMQSNLSATGWRIVNHVLNAKDNFPLMAVCLGWEMLLMSLAYDYTGTLLYSNYSEFNVAAPIHILGAQNDTQIWSPLNNTLRNNAQTKPYFFFDHTHGILESNFTNTNISKYLKMTSTSSPIKNPGPDFVASAEGINKPIFGSQFHPEKLAYEWNVPAPHNAEALAISQNYIDTFMNEARKNNRTFYNNQTLTQSLIYNFIPSTNSASFSQVYTFPTVVQNQSAWPALFNSTTPSKVQADHIESYNYFAPQDAKMLRGARI